MQVSFSRGLNVAELKDKLKKFWAPRLSQVENYVIPATNDAGRPNGNDHACITMQLLRPLLDLSIYDALSVLNVISQIPEHAGNGWNVTYSTFRKRTEAKALHKAYYDKVDIKKVTWTTANLKYAPSTDNWDTHMKMLAEVVVAVEAVYDKEKNIVFDAIEMACKAIEILDTINPADVSRKPPLKENKPERTEKKQRFKKRSRAAAERATTFEAPLAVPAPTRNLRPRRNTVCTSEIDEHFVINLETASRKPVKKAVKKVVRAAAAAAAAPAPAPPAPAPLVIDFKPSIVGFMNNQAEEEAQLAMDQQLAQDSDDILFYFTDSLGKEILDELKVFEVEEPAAEANQQQQQDQMQQMMQQSQLADMQQTMQQFEQLPLPLPYMMPSLRDGDLFF